MYVLSQADIAQSLGNASQWGVAGALMLLAFGFISYLKWKEALDREERKNTAEQYQKVIDNLSSKVEAMATTLTTAFAAEMAAERIEHRQDVEQIGQLVHDIRGLAQEAVSAKELSQALASKVEEQNRGKPKGT